MIPSIVLDALRAHHDDDAPRLHLATSLRAQGDPRGEFIQVQCALAHLEPEASGEWMRLRKREHALLEAHGSDWLALVGLAPDEGQFVRGLIERVDLSWARYLELNETLAHAELVREVRLTEMPDDPADAIELLLDTPLISHVQSLVLDGNCLGEAGISALGTKTLTGLVSLGLNDVGLGERAGEILANLPLMAHLEHLTLADNALLDRGLIDLLSSRYLKNLVSLDLASNQIHAQGVNMLVSSPVFPRLLHLDLKDSRPGESGIHALASSTRSRLTSLSLAYCALGAVNLRALFGSRSMAQITALDLRGNTLSGVIDGLLESRTLDALTSLELSENWLDEESLAPLMTSTLMSRLTALSLAANPLDAGAIDLFRNGRFTRTLQYLDLSNTHLDSDGAERLSNAMLWRLTHLDLHQNNIDDRGVEAIANADWLRCLTRLDLSSNWICGPGLRMLENSTHLSCPDALSLGDNYIPESFDARLRARFGQRVL